MKTVPSAELASYIEQPLPPSDWLKVEQSQISAFADATLDHQFIHVDPERAAQTPFGRTVAHGYLTLSLVSHFLAEAGLGPDNVQMAINYGTDKVRFLEPVKVDQEIRGHAMLLSVTEKRPGQLLLKTRMTIEIRGEDNPAMVAEILTLFFCG